MQEITAGDGIYDNTSGEYARSVHDMKS
jgi:hypothetical protein